MQLISNKISQVFLALVNAGVLLSVILLIFELRQNQEIAIAEIRNDISRQAVERDVYMSTPEIAEIFVKAGKGGELNDIQQFQLARANGIIFQNFENIVYQYEAGMYSEEEFQAVEERIRSLPPIMANHYAETSSDYSPAFQRAMVRIQESE